MKYKSIILAVSAALALSACGEKVEVPPAHVGKVLGKNGFAPETLPPSKFRLEPCWAYCDKLALLEVNDTGLKEQLKVFMPDDKLNLTVEIRGTYSIPADKKTTDAIFDRVTGDSSHGKSSKITASQIYSIYGRQAVRGIVRSEITKYSIADILAKREAIGKNIHDAISKKLSVTKTPITISRFELAKVLPPEFIVEAQAQAKGREIAIQQAEADAQVQLVEAERALEVAKKDRLVEREKAEAIAEQNRIAAKSITPGVLEYKRLETAETIYKALAASENTIIIPLDSGGFDNFSENAALARQLGKEIR